MVYKQGLGGFSLCLLFFFGGGTPSLVPPRLLQSVLDAIRDKFGVVAADAEVLIEMDPGTFDARRMEELAFQEDLLRLCGRAHGRWEGIKSWSLDLISSLPGQTEEMWDESLRLTLSAGPPHISVYDLQVQQGTKFVQLRRHPPVDSLDPDEPGGAGQAADGDSGDQTISRAIFASTAGSSGKDTATAGQNSGLPRRLSLLLTLLSKSSAINRAMSAINYRSAPKRMKPEQ
ncbi:hypothetical protein KSP39_PZI020712 [Platanthera zijinensis]|uniref:Uncharacterized protein n=1 Tax=Platanthera zijinensis TaxID=2320716 RepID=A0AAP0FXL3_9ASPA